jgi:hypothetical protein
MIVNGNANAKTGKKETQRCKGARTQGKPGSQNLKEHFHGAFLPASRVQSWVQSSANPLLIFFLAPLRLCAFAFFSWSSLRLCVSFFFLLAFLSDGHEKKSADSRLRRIG